MAKRRKLEAPDPSELAAYEVEFRGETRRLPMAPIGAVAAESAAAADLRDADARAEAERHRAEAEAFADARGRGLVLDEVALELIDETAMIRDRAIIAEDELLELRNSIQTHGLRLPIEIYELPEPASGKVYGLLSGYRRLLAVRQLHEMTEHPRHATIRALLRDPAALGGTFSAMVEENEVRANLSHFERGRIAVLAAGQGAFADVEAAVNGLFGAASKARRSKVRSFALIFEELGDLLVGPEAMTEAQGLRLAGALRAGAEPDLRAALETLAAEDFESAWQKMTPIIAATEAQGKPGARGGRPRSAARQQEDERRLPGGIRVRRFRTGRGYTLELEGDGLDGEIMESLMVKLESLLSRD